MSRSTGWLDEYSRETAFQQAWERESFIESFLVRIEQELDALKMSRVQLAEAMECRPSNITRIMKNTANLTAEKMVDMARAVGLQARVMLSPRVRSECKIKRFPSPPGMWNNNEQNEWADLAEPPLSCAGEMQ